ncbi:MAG: hypothetical protein ACLU6Y_05770 [Ruminococcus sp.]
MYDLQVRAIPDETLEKAELEIKTTAWGKGSVHIVLAKDGQTVLEENKSLGEVQGRFFRLFILDRRGIPFSGVQKIPSFTIWFWRFSMKTVLFRKSSRRKSVSAASK